ncbi:MAG: hypothetical protein EPN43_06635 [Jatrophihabitans sp.]|nr:MAG: hypothetical protein EPN43_06635 [Jatrophihabitans sp.]
MSSAQQAVGRRLGVVTVDQVVSGGSNVLASVLAARTLDPAGFGRFSLAFLVYVLAQGAGRAMICNPVLVRPVQAGRRTRQVLASGLLFGLWWAAAVLLAAAAIAPLDRRFAAALGVLALCLPLVMVQDLGRFLAIAFREPTVALRLDLIWLILMVAVVGGLTVTGVHSLVALMAAWAGSGAVAGIAVLVRWRAVTVRPSRAWLADTWGLAWRFTFLFAALQLSILGLAALVRKLYGAATVGALLGAQLFIRPYSTIDAALTGSAVAEIAHEAQDRSFVWRHIRRITVVATVAATINAVVMVFLPDPVGRLALGATWPSAKQFLAPLAVQVVLLAITVGPRAGLVGIGHINRLVLLNVAFLPVLVVAAVLGAVWGGALGCAWGMTAGWAFAAITWWLAMVATDGRPAPPPAVPHRPRHSRSRSVPASRGSVPPAHGSAAAPAGTPAPDRPRPRPRPAPVPSGASQSSRRVASPAPRDAAAHW